MSLHRLILILFNRLFVTLHIDNFKSGDMRHLLLPILIISALQVCGQASVPSAAIQVKTALLAAPQEKRDSATVYGYNAEGELVILRQGTNEMYCVADDPKKEGFSVACYHRDLHPFMQRGRDLREMGRTNEQVFAIREKEAKSGELVMPRQPATLYVFSAKAGDYNAGTGEVKNGYLRYVIYIPYATAASTGLAEKPAAPGMPWIMHPGTHGAHIMINPPQKK